MAFVVLALPALAGATVYAGVQAQKLVHNVYFHPSSKSNKPLIRKNDSAWRLFKRTVFGSPETYYDKLTGKQVMWSTVVEPLYYLVSSKDELNLIIMYAQTSIELGNPASFEAFMTYIMQGSLMTATTLVNIQDIYKAVEKLVSLKSSEACSEVRTFVERLVEPTSPFRTN